MKSLEQTRHGQNELEAGRCRLYDYEGQLRRIRREFAGRVRVNQQRVLDELSGSRDSLSAMAQRFRERTTTSTGEQERLLTSMADTMKERAAVLAHLLETIEWIFAPSNDLHNAPRWKHR
ncbi:hypothetical protein ACFXD5_15745 [Streptomyces sp. NPDC059385]|uniref:hypothetical protein n=1 Tax=Streptomyces sp. NPDC059385 TaxID=3346817 RepID=UPI0036BEAA51